MVPACETYDEWSSTDALLHLSHHLAYCMHRVKRDEEKRLAKYGDDFRKYMIVCSSCGGA